MARTVVRRGSDCRLSYDKTLRLDLAGSIVPGSMRPSCPQRSNLMRLLVLFLLLPPPRPLMLNARTRSHQCCAVDKFLGGGGGGGGGGKKKQKLTQTESGATLDPAKSSRKVLA